MKKDKNWKENNWMKKQDILRKKRGLAIAMSN